MATKVWPRVRPWAGLAVVLGLVLAVFHWTRVCDDQLASTGQVVSVCRHMAITDPPMVILGLIALLILSAAYTEISGFGITLKSKVAEIDQRTKHTERATNELQETVGDLADFNREHVLVTPPETLVPTRVPDARIAALAERYNILRWTMTSGRERTRRMGEVVHQIRTILRDADDFDVLGHLENDDRGVRLAAYAYLRDHVRPDMVARLTAATLAEEKPFGQYTALRALRHQLDNGAPPLDRQERDMLRRLRERIGHDTDRGHIIAAMLGEDDQPVP